MTKQVAANGEKIFQAAIQNSINIHSSPALLLPSVLWSWKAGEKSKSSTGLGGGGACSPTLQVIIVGVLSHPAVQEGPSKVVHSILLVLNGLGDNLSIEVIVHAVVQMRLNWERFIQELLEEILELKKQGSQKESLSFTLRNIPIFHLCSITSIGEI